MPYWMEILLTIIVANWVLPLIMWLYPLSMMLFFKDFKWEGFHGPFGKFRLANKELEPWHARWWKDWAGSAMYWFMCYRDRPGEADDAFVERTILHEGGHCWHMVILGVIGFYLSYIFHSLWIFITQKIRWAWIKATKKRAIGEYNRWMRILEEKDGSVVKAVYEDEPYTKHAYIDNWSERLARRRAGQLVDIHPSEWRYEKDDLWPWW